MNMLNLDCTQGVCIAPFSIVKYGVEEDEPFQGGGRFYADGWGWVKPACCWVRYPQTIHLRAIPAKQATDSKIMQDVFVKGDAWFNTGDLIRDIGYGHIQFVDRTGDTFRWKGENVSTTEVEKVANSFDQVSLSAVYGVAMPGGDGRAGMTAIIPECDVEAFDFAGLADHFQRSLPSYAVPKFIRYEHRTGLHAHPQDQKGRVEKRGL